MLDKKQYKWFSCCFSVTKSCLIPCDPMDCSMPGFPVLHYLPEFAQTHVHWLIQWCHPTSHPLSSPSPLPSMFPASGSFPTSQLFKSGGQIIVVSALVLVLQVNIQGLSFRINWFDLLAVWGTLQSLLKNNDSRASILEKFSITARKTIALPLWTLVDKVMSLFFNKLSRFAVAFLLRS